MTELEEATVRKDGEAWIWIAGVLFGALVSLMIAFFERPAFPVHEELVTLQKTVQDQTRKIDDLSVRLERLEDLISDEDLRNDRIDRNKLTK